jgi:hypothetical protein
MTILPTQSISSWSSVSMSVVISVRSCVGRKYLILNPLAVCKYPNRCAAPQKNVVLSARHCLRRTIRYINHIDNSNISFNLPVNSCHGSTLSPVLLQQPTSQCKYLCSFLQRAYSLISLISSFNVTYVQITSYST